MTNANPQRRSQLSDAANDLLASGGSRGITHRAVDLRAGVPDGTAKNYFTTRDALLQAAADRCVERYGLDLERATAHSKAPSNRRQLVRALSRLLRQALTSERTRLLAFLELSAEATRNRTLQQKLEEITRSDFALHERLHRAAGLPVTPARLTMFMMTMQGALFTLLTSRGDIIEELGLKDMERFLSRLLSAVYPEA